MFIYSCATFMTFTGTQVCLCFREEPLDHTVLGFREYHECYGCVIVFKYFVGISVVQRAGQGLSKLTNESTNIVADLETSVAVSVNKMTHLKLHNTVLN